MKKLFSATLLAFLACHPAFAQLPENDIQNFQNQAKAAMQKGDAAGAQTAIDQSLSTAEKAFGNSEKMIDPLEFAARAYTAIRQLPLAERSYQRIIQIHQQTKSPHDPQVAVDEADLATFYAQTGKMPQADNYYRQAVDILDREASYRTSTLPPILDNFARVLDAEGKTSEAKDIREKAQKYRDRRF